VVETDNKPIDPVKNELWKRFEEPEELEIKQPRRLRTMANYSALVVLACIVGVSFYNQQIGQWLVITAGIAGIFLKVDFAFYFGGALFCMAMIALLSTIGSQGLAGNYAVYAYLLFVLGIFNSILFTRGHATSSTNRA
jgi:hypothetical protein